MLAQHLDVLGPADAEADAQGQIGLLPQPAELAEKRLRQPIALTSLIAANGFDYVYYLQQNPDVAAAHVDPFVHFETVGWKEGRNPNALFDVNGYLATYTDVAAAGVNPLDHYHVSGWTEGMLESRAKLIADNIERAARGEPPVNLVAPPG